MQRVIIGTGYTGRRVLDALGDDVRGFRRRPGDGTLPLDLDDGRAALPPLPDDYALLYTVPPRREAGTDVRLTRLLSLLEPIPSRIVYLGTSGVYGDCGGRLVDERSAPRPRTARAQLRLDAERQLSDWTAARGVALVLLRVPGIYGPGRLGLERIRAGTPILREEEAHPGNRIHVDDLVGGCLAALADDCPAGIYNLSDGDHRSQTWFSHTVARLAGVPPSPVVSRAEAARIFPAGRLSFLDESRRLDNRRMLDLLRTGLRWPDPEDGIRASLAADGLPSD